MKKVKNILKKYIQEEIRTQIKYVIRRMQHSGNSCYCPLCESSFDTFQELGYDLPVISEKQIIGGGLRKALCPVCGSSDRSRLLHLFIQSQTGLYNERLKLLHIAPEAVLSRKLKKNKNLEYLTADINPENVMVQMDLTQIQYPDGSFGAVIANHVLEHIPDDRKAMAEIFRVLRPGGFAILQVPLSKILEKTYEDFSITEPVQREQFFGQTDHVRIYGQDYRTRLMEAGFEVNPYHWTENAALAPEGKRFGLNTEEVVFCCYKKKNNS